MFHRRRLPETMVRPEVTPSTVTFLRRALLSACVIFAANGFASVPSSHSVTVPTTPGETVTVEWTGITPAGVNPASACTLPLGVGEDRHGLQIAVPAGAYDAVDVTAEFSIRWSPGTNVVVATDPDLILTVKRGTVAVDSSDGGDPSESVVLTNPAPGAYDAVSCAFLA